MTARQSYQSPTRGRPSCRLVSEDLYESLERCSVQRRYLQVIGHIVPSLQGRVEDLVHST